MENSTPLVVRSLEEVEQYMKLMPRAGQCVDCNKDAKLTCPACTNGQTCQYTVPSDCTQCPRSFCTKDESISSGSSGDSSGPSAGPIAGGVVGGLAALAIIAYLLWRFLIKPKRGQEREMQQQQQQKQHQQQYRQYQHSVYEADTNPVRSEREKDDAASRLSRRSSTRSVHSIASTVLTRASNIIQIAYIPGVTNRAAPASPGVLVPPVPPIPIQHAEEGRERAEGDQHFFVPGGELRDSTYSGISSYSDRTSYAPRSSIASTIYGKQAQIQTPAQTGMRAKPTVVSVKSAGGGSNPNTPPVPSINFEKFAGGHGSDYRPESSATAYTIGSMQLSNANTATSARAQMVKLGNSSKKLGTIGDNPDAASSQESLASGSSRDTSNAMTLVAESPSMEHQGPFSDPSERQRTLISQPALGPVMEEAEDRRTSSAGGSSRGSQGPFSDNHAAKTP